MAHGSLQIVLALGACALQLHQVAQCISSVKPGGAGAGHAQSIVLAFAHEAAGAVVGQEVPLACLQTGGQIAQREYFPRKFIGVCPRTYRACQCQEHCQKNSVEFIHLAIVDK